MTNKRFWQRMAKLYGPSMKSSGPLYDNICTRIRPYLTQEMKVLELACGSGQFSFRLAGDTGQWDATDFSDRMVAEARKRLLPQSLRFAVCDATALPYDAESYDAVLIANALHIMPEPDKAMSEIRRVVKTGGCFFAPTFIWGTDVRLHISARMMECTGFHVFHKWDEKGFAEYVSSWGFSVLEQVMLGGSIRPLCCLAARKV